MNQTIYIHYDATGTFFVKNIVHTFSIDYSIYWLIKRQKEDLILIV